jgi:hypothetical protein
MKRRAAARNAGMFAARLLPDFAGALAARRLHPGYAAAP